MSELEDKLNSLLSDPEELGRVTEMAKGLMDSGLGDKLSGLFGGGGEENSAVPQETKPAQKTAGSGDMILDGNMLAGLGKMMSAASKGSDKTALLSAMKPYLAEKRRNKMDRAMKIAKIAKIAGAALSERGGDRNGL